MSGCRLRVVVTIFLCFFVQTSFAITNPKNAFKRSDSIAEWTMLMYMAADNNLVKFYQDDINELVVGLSSTDKVNILVQLDKPWNRKTLRYRITPNGAVEAGSLSVEMGFNPEEELTNAMQWAVSNYPAKKYAIILWNHGSGILDFSPAVAKKEEALFHWMKPSKLDSPVKGFARSVASIIVSAVAYDDTQGTCLTNQGMSGALEKIKKIIGKKLDLIVMEACLMAMVEVAYQMKDLVELFVASEEIMLERISIPFTPIIKQLSQNPTQTTALQFAKNCVDAYEDFYTNKEPWNDFTLSTIDINSIKIVTDNINQFVRAVYACSRLDFLKTEEFITEARAESKSFYTSNYIDLYSFYTNVSNKVSEVLSKMPPVYADLKYREACFRLNNVVKEGLNRINQVVLHNVFDKTYSKLGGLSIYYPKYIDVHQSYKQTNFVKDVPSWLPFIQQFS